MNHLLAPVFFFICLTGFSQQDSLTITTHLEIDSICIINQKVNYSYTNDTVLKMKIDRNKNAINSKLLVYSEKRAYEINLPSDPVTAFPGEWNVRDPKNALMMRMSLKAAYWVIMTADGSATNLLLPLAVYNTSGELILDESCGVNVVKKKSRKAYK